MIIVTGSVRERTVTLAAVLQASLEHVRRSRTEPGCLLHSVHQSVEDPLLVVFLEHWADRDALTTHFAQPGSNDFVKRVAALAAERPSIEIYEAAPVSL
jgi:quinol monooxygenase YgiN